MGNASVTLTSMRIGLGSEMTNGKYLSYVTNVILLSLHGKVWYWGELQGWLL